MKDDFETIIDLFSLEAEEKEKRLDEIFRLSIAFIDKYKHIQQEGTEKEREAISKKLSILREKISVETKASEASLSLSSKEIKELSNDEKNFTKEQWELLQKTKVALSKEQMELSAKKKLSLEQGLKKASNSSGPKKKSKRGSSSWLKS